MRNKLILSLAAVVLLMSNVYVGRAQLELAWENTNYHYQYFNRYKKVIQAEEGLVDMKTGNFIYKYDSVGYVLTPDGSRLFTYKRINKSDTVLCTIYDFDTFQILDTFKYKSGSKGLVIHGVTMNNDIVYYHDGKSAVIFWDIKTRQIVDTIHYKTPVFNVITSPSNEEFTKDGRYMSFQYHTISDQGTSGEYFVILDLLTSERVYAKYVNKGISYEFMNSNNIMIYPETIHNDALNKDEYFLQFFDLNERKISKSIKLETRATGVTCVLKNDKLVLLRNDEGRRLFDLENNRMLDYIIPEGSTPNLIFADDSLLYAKNAAYRFDWTVGVDNQSNKIEEITVFPNPTGSFINLKLPDSINPKKWEIIDMRGNILLKNINCISNALKIDITQLQPETYILRIYTDKTVMNFKIIRE